MSLPDRIRRSGHRAGALAAAVMLALGTFLLVPVVGDAIVEFADTSGIELAAQAEDRASMAQANAPTRVWGRLVGGLYLFLLFAALAAAAYVACRAIAWTIAALFEDA